MPARKPKPRARRSAPVAWPRLPQLEQRQLDLIGLGLVAAAVFFAFLIYLGWDGGSAGGRAVDGLRRLVASRDARGIGRAVDAAIVDDELRDEQALPVGHEGRIWNQRVADLRSATGRSGS